MFICDKIEYSLFVAFGLCFLGSILMLVNSTAGLLEQ